MPHPKATKQRKGSSNKLKAQRAGKVVDASDLSWEVRYVLSFYRQGFLQSTGFGQGRIVREITVRSHWKRGSTFTTHAVSFRSVRSDERSQSIVLHYLTDGSAVVRLLLNKQEYFIPLVLCFRALCDTSDQEIRDAIGVVAPDDNLLLERVELMLKQSHAFGLFSREDVLAFIGTKFRSVLDLADRSDLSDCAVGSYLLRHYLFWHLDSDRDKYNLLTIMAQKLYRLALGQIKAENADAACHQEMMLPGSFFSMYLSEHLEAYLLSAKRAIESMYRTRPEKADIMSKAWMADTLQTLRTAQIGSQFDHFMATGNVVTRTGLDLMQVAGYTIMADRVNFVRFLSHFRAIHRGTFFTTMKTTAVRKLLPESFGFLCCVHTPDGSPCGLLNHITELCDPVTGEATEAERDAVLSLLLSQGMTPMEGVPENRTIPVVVDGRPVGTLRNVEAGVRLAEQLRLAKGTSLYPRLEVAMVHGSEDVFPGLYLFTTRSRFSRPVKSLQTGRTEWVGSLEQIFMGISLFGSETDLAHHTHQELVPTAMLSLVASTTPFSDHNQSPRNIYQCQMLKQTMGQHCLALPCRADNKSYRILTPERSLVRNGAQDRYGLDSYPTGTNAVVAVISYTGYDMEDACIINKASLDRGMFRGIVYTTQDIDMADDRSMRRTSKDQIRRFCNVQADGSVVNGALDDDGLPRVGMHLKPGDAIAAYFDPVTQKYGQEKYKKKEAGKVESVRVLGHNEITGITRIRVTVIHDRTPIVGDKFSSRHGQKGVLGVKWKYADMPFTGNGVTPDLIINPHAFPSRMTIGMLIESVAGKGATYNGKDVDATPFQWSDERRAVNIFGDELVKHGYNRAGSETLYSGINGQAMEVEIFIGVVHYQRLRHMVSDKYQVRAMGPIDQVTRQPIKGRKRGGGIRFGEMERDAMIAHGTMEIMRGRLCLDSDAETAAVCTKCGSLLGVVKNVGCLECGAKQASNVTIPTAFRVLSHELASMGVKLSAHVKPLVEKARDTAAELAAMPVVEAGAVEVE
ncbi:DNA-directed RNA polymerase, subunit 2 [Kipferlia bialata]|uniref:DNA-directed RNA polymerase subunit beta n=1 Tax=Kipferlia bialata TaxID=797122 RepID=A0A9K3CSQ8_9EUKA|nr:DNA-directed RNA polymerase, subunit 2 [Kipferlia bialata]GIQ85405.1 DNA-directed RNA polymerase, subunit 2 [Kipferlia bialata]|eukprot:g3001.t1